MSESLTNSEFGGEQQEGAQLMMDTLRQDLRLDLVAFDKRDQPILAVEVKAMNGAAKIGLDWLFLLESNVRSNVRPIPYWMFVDLDNIIIFSYRDGSKPPSTELIIHTATALGAYDPEFERKRIFDDYLVALVEAWLRDFAFEWRSANPPAMKELTEIGLAERLKGGMTHSEVRIADLGLDPLRRNQLRDEPFSGTGPGD